MGVEADDAVYLGTCQVQPARNRRQRRGWNPAERTLDRVQDWQQRTGALAMCGQRGLDRGEFIGGQFDRAFAWARPMSGTCQRL